MLSGVFYNGVNGGTGTYTFTAYPSTSGILLLEIDNLGISAGAAFPQSATTFAASQGYGLNLTGSNSNGEVDDIAEFTANAGGTLSNGLIDENDEGSLASDQKLGSGGTYTFDSTGSGRGILSYPATDTTFIGTLNLAFYVANSSTAIFIDGDSAQAGSGLFQLQGSSTSSAALRTYRIPLRCTPWWSSAGSEAKMSAPHKPSGAATRPRSFFFYTQFHFHQPLVTFVTFNR